MATTTANTKLRHNEYYGQQSTFDELYERSLNGAKFNKHSYGFRPNRSTEHAKATMHRMINLQHLHFVGDIDIKGFYDNVDHGKLLKQMWTMGIQDKNLLCIISAMLKAEIEGIGIPSKGVPQGGLCEALHNPPYAKKVIMRSKLLQW